MPYSTDEPCQPLSKDFESWFDQLDGFSPRFGLDAIRRRQPKQKTPPYPEHYVPSEDGSEVKESGIVDECSRDGPKTKIHPKDGVKSSANVNFSGKYHDSHQIHDGELEKSVENLDRMQASSSCDATDSPFTQETNVAASRGFEKYHDLSSFKSGMTHSCSQGFSPRLELSVLKSSPRKSPPPYPESYFPSDSDSTSLTPRQKADSTTKSPTSTLLKRQLPKGNILEKIKQYEQNITAADTDVKAVDEKSTYGCHVQLKNGINIVHPSILPSNIRDGSHRTHITEENFEAQKPLTRNATKQGGDRFVSRKAPSEPSSNVKNDTRKGYATVQKPSGVVETKHDSKEKLSQSFKRHHNTTKATLKVPAPKRYLDSITTGSECEDDLSYFENCTDSIFQYELSDSSTECDTQSQCNTEIADDKINNDSANLHIKLDDLNDDAANLHLRIDDVDGESANLSSRFDRELKNESNVLKVEYEKPFSDVTSECHTDFDDVKSSSGETIVEDETFNVLQEYIDETQLDDFEILDLDNLSGLESCNDSNLESSEIKLEYDERLFETDTSVGSNSGENSHSDEFYSCHGNDVVGIHDNQTLQGSVTSTNHQREDESNTDVYTDVKSSQSSSCDVTISSNIKEWAGDQNFDETTSRFLELQKQESFRDDDIVGHKRAKSDSAVTFFKLADIEQWASEDGSLTATEARVLNVLKTSRLFIKSGNRNDPQQRRTFWRNYKYNRRKNRQSLKSASFTSKLPCKNDSSPKTQPPGTVGNISSSHDPLHDATSVGLKVISSIKVVKDTEYLSLSLMENASPKPHVPQTTTISVKDRIKEWDKGHVGQRMA